MKEILFHQKELDLARTYLKQGCVKSVLFSEGTYQVEVEIDQTIFWPFLQLNEQGEVLDAFCSCSLEEKRKYCVHLAAAYLTLLKGSDTPLHIRFKESFWNQLCLMASRRHGYRTDCLERGGDGYVAHSLKGKSLFALKPLNEEGLKKVEELIDSRALETEETSLKFSNLSPEEILLWKHGKPSEKLKYELSFWSDLAKWCMVLQNDKKNYQIEFFPQEKQLPQWVKITFDAFELKFYIAKVNWPLLIPSLRSVNSPLPLHEKAERRIQAIIYDPEKKQFLLEFLTPVEGESSLQHQEEIEVEGWRFIPGKGFFSSKIDSIFESNVIQEEKVDGFLSRYASLLRRYLKEVVFEGIYRPRYHLHFDASHTLHIEMFLFEQGDLKEKGSAFFGHWAFLPGKGFYHLEASSFFTLETLIPSNEVSDFISRHKIWLNRFEGFQIHLMTVEPELSYEIDSSSHLLFSSKMEVTQDVQGVIDFGEWIFIPGKGFLPKRKEKMISTLKAGKRVSPVDIPLFIRHHKEELVFLPHFFSEKSPVDKVSLEVTLSSKGALHVKPVYSLLFEYQKKKVLFFQEYSYVEGEGFSKLLLHHPVLEEYAIEKELTPKEEVLFFSKIETLQPWISKMDPRVKVPKNFSVKLLDMVQKEKVKASGWALGLQIETELGSVDLYEVWKAMQSHRPFLFSEAGLLDLTSDRFQWLKTLSKKKWSGSGKTLFLSTIEWIRVQMLEKISLPKDPKTLQRFEEFHSYQSSLPLNTDGLKSNLRPYQEMGLHWLWFLYSYGLSGLLCDEMGLGKTHQAMALLAAVFNKDAEKKSFLIVCPTSVIYHWEDLLHRFLPHLSVYVFYGHSRQLEDFSSKQYDVLLTSYGIVRSEKKELSKLLFHVAVFDEIQNAKNAHSQTHRALLSLQSTVRIGLTGTPIENHIMELKALFDLILPHYLPSDPQFKEQFLIPIERVQDQTKKQELSKIIKPFILRRKKSEVLKELPEKTEEIAYCDLSEEQRTLYKQLFYAQKDLILQDLKGTYEAPMVMHVFALLSKLKQVCDHPCLITKDKEKFSEHSSGKWDLFVELLGEALASKQKVVVFTQYLDMMDIIELYLDRSGIGYAEIRGSTKDRKAALERFKEDPDCEVFVASLQAAGVGIDLTAASIVIHYDRWWNPAREDQATDRVHRIGQSRGVQVFKLVTKKSVEEKIHQLILKKKGILDEVVGFDEHDAVKKLTKQEIFELFSALGQELSEE